MPSFGITLGYQKDKCSVCKYEKEIRIIFDKENHLIAKICDRCVEEQGDKTASQIIKEYGEKTTAEHIEILTKEQMEKSGFNLTGVKEDLKEKMEKKD